MSIYCQKCGTENLDNAKFCKSCGTVLSFETKTTSTSSVIQTVKKIILWVIILIVIGLSIAIFIGYQYEKNRNAEQEREKAEVEELRLKCENNDGDACFKLCDSSFIFYTNREERIDALAKGCRLGNKDACRKGEYYREGCELKDGESCYKLALEIIGPVERKRFFCDTSPEGAFCQSYINGANKAKRYYEKACDYGYSQGCMAH